MNQLRQRDAQRLRRQSLIRAGLAMVALAMLSSAGCGKKLSNSYQGYVEGKFVYVASPQAGRLKRLAVSRGQSVRALQPLFSLDPEPERAAELQARALLGAEQSRLRDLKAGKRPAEKDVVSAQLVQAEVEQRKSLALLNSDEAQVAAGGLPQTDLIQARAAADSSAARVRQLQSELAVAALPGREAQIRAQAALVEADQAALEQAAWRLRQKQVQSPGRALVFDTLYREGEWVSAGSPVVQLLPPENIEIRFFVPEAAVGSLKLGQRVGLGCDGCAADLSATITFISPQVEYTPPVIYSNETRAKLVFMILAAPAAEKAASLHPGQPIEVTLR